MASKNDEKIDPKTGEVVESKAVTTLTAGGEVATTEEFDYSAYSDDAGAGFDNQTSEDVGIPFWVMLQPGSPEVLAEDSEIKAGSWMNRTTGEVVAGKEGIAFIPVITMHEMVEWKTRKTGGGLVGRHAIDGDLAGRARASQPLGTYKHPDQWRPGLSEEELDKINDLVETFTVYGLVVDPATGLPSPGIINFSSTHIKPYKDWQYKQRMLVIPLPNGGRLTSKQLPMWAVCWCLRAQRNEKNGNTWFTPTVGYAGMTAVDSLVKPGSEMYLNAKALYEAVKSGEAKADEASLKGTSDGGAPAQQRQASTSQEEAPY